MSDISELDARTQDALHDVEKAIKVITSNDWTDTAQYEEDWINDVTRPGLALLKLAILNIEQARKLFANDFHEANEDAKREKWSDL